MKLELLEVKKGDKAWAARGVTKAEPSLESKAVEADEDGYVLLVYAPTTEMAPFILERIFSTITQGMNEMFTSAVKDFKSSSHRK